MTTHYFAVEIDYLISRTEKVCDLGCRKSVALSTCCRVECPARILDIVGRKRGSDASIPAL